MANKLDPMDLKQIITLHLDGLSNRQIGNQLGINRNTVNHYMNQFDASDRPLEELRELDNAKLEAHFPSATTIKNRRYDQLMLYFEKLNRAREHPGFTFQYHHQQYKEAHPDGYGYTQFMEHYHRQFNKLKGSLKLNHQAGREVFIDFAGKKLHLTDPETGEQVPVEVFVSVLPHSQYTYVEACESQKREDLIRCMVNAFSFYGGVPLAIVSDNLKSAVSRASKYEPEINRSFKDFAQHYNCVVNPTRSYAPQDKALVENAVQLAYQRIYHPLREMTFFSLADLNREIRKLLEGYNSLLFQRKDASRKELFQSVERQYLKPLPAEPYELKNYCRAKVQKMGYVYFSPDKSYYSVPYRHIGQYTQIQYTKSAVEVYHNHQRIALHQRNPAPGSYNTKKDHLSSAHKAYTQWHPDYFKTMARRHGPFVEAFVSALFNQADYPEPHYRKAMGIIQLHKNYGSQRLNKACERALLAEALSYHRVKNILKNNQDLLENDLKELNENQSHIPPHENTRGASQYT